MEAFENASVREVLEQLLDWQQALMQLVHDLLDEVSRKGSGLGQGDPGRDPAFADGNTPRRAPSPDFQMRSRDALSARFHLGRPAE